MCVFESMDGETKAIIVSFYQFAYGNNIIVIITVLLILIL
jgi:hypothetical protein